jgi:hypothetical protein
MMRDPRLDEILRALDPKPGAKLWFGGASPLGCLRGVDAAQASWRPHPDRHSIWDLTLHIAYWRYAVRRHLEPPEEEGFPRSPANWPAPPDAPDDTAWKRDRSLARQQEQLLVAAVRGFDPRRLDDQVPGSKSAYRYMDLLTGILMHDTYHVGQIQELKRLHRAKHARSASRRRRS